MARDAVVRCGRGGCRYPVGHAGACETVRVQLPVGALDAPPEQPQDRATAELPENPVLFVVLLLLVMLLVGIRIGLAL